MRPARYTDAIDPPTGDDVAGWMLCSGSSGGGGNTTQTTKTELPAWLEKAGEDNYHKSEEIARQPYQAYNGQRIAGQSPEQQQVGAQITGMQGDTSAALGSLGSTITSQIGGYNPQQVNAQRLGGMDLSQYMNPFTGEVETNALRALESTRQGAQNQIGDAFQSSKAFGGSRQALQSAVTDAQFGQQAGDLSAKLRQANFAQAQQAATGDITRDMTAQQLNQAAGLQGAGLNLQGYQAAADLVDRGHRADIADIGLLDTYGGQQQQMAQGGLDLKYQDFLEKQGYDKSQIEWLHQMLASSPGSQTTTVTGNAGGSKGNMALGILGGAASGASAGSMIAPGYGTAIGAVAGGVLGGLGSR